MISKIKKENLYPIITFLIVFTVIVFFFCKSGEYFANGKSYIENDGNGYYRYFSQFFGYIYEEDAHTVFYPIGTVLMQLPFLFPALFISKILNIDIDYGYGLVLQRSVIIAAALYCILGLIFLYKIVRLYFSDKIASFTILSIFFGTMLPFYTMYDPAYSHVYGFFLCSLFMYFTVYYEKKYYDATKRQKILLDILFGIILGLNCIIRYTNFLVVFFYIFYNVHCLDDFKKRMKIIFSKKIILQILIPICAVMIQVFFYKLYFGKYMIHGYGNYLFIHYMHPLVYKVLFSANKGLFIFCPVLFLGFLAMFLIKIKNNIFAISQPFIFIVLTYLISAWHGWWLGYAYTERLYCDILCIFALPIASVFNAIQENYKTYPYKIIKYLMSTMIIVFIILNLIWIHGCIMGKIHMNMASWYVLRKCLTDFLYAIKHFFC